MRAESPCRFKSLISLIRFASGSARFLFFLGRRQNGAVVDQDAFRLGQSRIGFLAFHFDTHDDIALVNRVHHLVIVEPGGGRQGSAQGCSVGWSTWASLQPRPSLFGFDGYRWLIDGALVASGPSYTPVVANIGHQLACSATVTYPIPLFVSAVATSPPVTVTAPPKPVLTRVRESVRTWRRAFRHSEASRRSC